MPVIETGVGNCTVYVDASADLDMAVAITVNSKTHRPSAPRRFGHQIARTVGRFGDEGTEARQAGRVS